MPPYGLIADRDIGASGTAHPFKLMSLVYYDV